MPNKGKPPPAVLAALKERQARQAALLSSVPEEARQMLERVLALRRQAKKVAARKQSSVAKGKATVSAMKATTVASAEAAVDGSAAAAVAAATEQKLEPAAAMCAPITSGHISTG